MVDQANGIIQPVEIAAVTSPLPRAGFVQPVEFIGPAPGPPGGWTLLQSGETILPNGSGDVKVSSDYTLGAGELAVAFVSQDGSTAIAVHNDSTNQNPGTNDVHWAIKASGGTVALYLRSGSAGGGTIRWTVYSLVP